MKLELNWRKWRTFPGSIFLKLFFIIKKWGKISLRQMSKSKLSVDLLDFSIDERNLGTRMFHMQNKEGSSITGKSLLNLFPLKIFDFV